MSSFEDRQLDGRSAGDCRNQTSTNTATTTDNTNEKFPDPVTVVVDRALENSYLP